MTNDPLHRFVFQPAIDRTGIKPGPAAMQALNLFLLVAVTLSGVRVATLDAATHPNLWFLQTIHVVGAVIFYAWLRFVIANGAIARMGALGALHLGVRIMMVCCAAIDVREIHVLLTDELPIVPISVMRSALQLVEDLGMVGALYLSMCDRPPPRRTKQSRHLVTA